jgi:membrane protein DedA with SNARE-associated domain
VSASDPPPTAADRWVQHPLALVLAFAWGLAEATWFFIVPDVLLTAIGCRSVRAGSKAAAVMLIGALLGGAFMYYAGAKDPDTARAWLTPLPGINREMIDRTKSQLNNHGLRALLRGPAAGIPYKIYAVESGARGSGLLRFLLVSVPARGIRFLLSLLAANGIARLLARWTRREPKTELAILVVIWSAFYVFYFVHFGW